MGRFELYLFMDQFLLDEQLVARSEANAVYPEVAEMNAFLDHRSDWRDGLAFHAKQALTVQGFKRIVSLMRVKFWESNPDSFSSGAGSLDADKKEYVRCWANFLRRHYRQIAAQALKGDFVDRDCDDGFVPLTHAELLKLDDKLDVLRRESRFRLFASDQKRRLGMMMGYDAGVQAWYTAPAVAQVSSNKRLWLQYLHPGSSVRLLGDAWNERLTGSKMHKVSGSAWKSHIESASLVPIVRHMPDDVVAMANVRGVNGFDAFGRSGDITDWGEFRWAGTLTALSRRQLVPSFGVALADLHEQGKYWGESTLPHTMMVVPDLVLFMDPDMIYEKCLSDTEKSAHDLLHLIVSLTNTFVLQGEHEPYHDIITRLLLSYGKPKILMCLRALAARKESARELYRFDTFTQYRVGAPLAEWHKTKVTLQRVIDEIMPYLENAQL